MKVLLVNTSWLGPSKQFSHILFLHAAQKLVEVRFFAIFNSHLCGRALVITCLVEVPGLTENHLTTILWINHIL